MELNITHERKKNHTRETWITDDIYSQSKQKQGVNRSKIIKVHAKTVNFFVLPW